MDGLLWMILGGGSSLITFTVDGTKYQAEDGMTWWQFINSTYNDGGFIAEYDTAQVKITVDGITEVAVGYNTNTITYANDVIEDKYIYTRYNPNGGAVE